MIVDFQHHFTPRELIKQDPGNRLIVHFDENGAPSYTIHSLLYDLDEHIRMMDTAGIDAAFLTSAAGMCASPEVSRLCNDKAKQAERDYRGRAQHPTTTQILHVDGPPKAIHPKMNGMLQACYR